MQRGARRDARAHGMADQAEFTQTERRDERGHVGGLRVEAVVEGRRCRRQATAAYVEYIGVVRAAQHFADEAPRDRRAGNARNQHDGGAIRA